MAKGRGLNCDAVVLDLEDSVAPSSKADARKRVVEAVSEGGWGGKEVVVRINPLDSSWGLDDLLAVCAANPAGIALPKVERVAQIAEVEACLSRHPGCTSTMWAMLETPLGVLNAAAIAACSPRLTCLVAGTSDLTKDLHALHTPDRTPLLLSLQTIVLAARAHGKQVLDGVHLDIHDDEGFRAACRQGRELGFDGKTLIHPRTIDAANEAFAPTANEVEHAQRVIKAFEDAQARGSGVVVVDNKLVENLHVDDARRILGLAAAIGDRGADE